MSDKKIKDVKDSSRSSDKSHLQKEKKIDLSLQEVAKQLEVLEASYISASKNMPAPVRYVEKRIQSLQEELDDISDNMLAHKLKRLASSKILQTVSEHNSAMEKGSAMEKADNFPAVPAQALEVSKPAGKSAKSRKSGKPTKPGKSARGKSAKPKGEGTYESTTFKCKSDLDHCLLSSKNALDKALCFALFIRCAIKG